MIVKCYDFNTFYMSIITQHIAECCKVAFVSRGPICKALLTASKEFFSFFFPQQLLPRKHYCLLVSISHLFNCFDGPPFRLLSFSNISTDSICISIVQFSTLKQLAGQFIHNDLYFYKLTFRIVICTVLLFNMM